MSETPHSAFCECMILRRSLVKAVSSAAFSARLGFSLSALSGVLVTAVLLNFPTRN